MTSSFLTFRVSNQATVNQSTCFLDCTRYGQSSRIESTAVWCSQNKAFKIRDIKVLGFRKDFPITVTFKMPGCRLAVSERIQSITAVAGHSFLEATIKPKGVGGEVILTLTDRLGGVADKYPDLAQIEKITKLFVGLNQSLRLDELQGASSLPVDGFFDCSGSRVLGPLHEALSAYTGSVENPLDFGDPVANLGARIACLEEEQSLKDVSALLTPYIEKDGFHTPASEEVQDLQAELEQLIASAKVIPLTSEGDPGIFEQMTSSFLGFFRD